MDMRCNFGGMLKVVDDGMKNGAILDAAAPFVFAAYSMRLVRLRDRSALLEFGSAKDC